MSFLKPKAATNSSSSTSQEQSNSSSQSGNTNAGLITSQYAPAMAQGTGATNFLSQLLGVSPGAVATGADQIGQAANGVAEAGGAQAGYQNYLQNAGYAPALAQLSRGVTGQGAASGLLNSGATGRSLLTQGTGLNQQFFNNYLQQLGNLSTQGQAAGNLVSNAGQFSNSNSNSTSNSTSQGQGQGGGPSTVGTIAKTAGSIAAIFSDRRLKTDIEKVDEFPDGLAIYNYRYKGSRIKLRGVMADDVAAIRPWALGPIVDGYATVNYGAL